MVASSVTAWETRFLLVTDRSLEEVAAWIEDAARYVDRIGHPAISGELCSQRWFVARLRGQPLLPGGCDEEADRIADRLAQLPFLLFFHEMLRLQLLVIEEDHHAALAAADRATALGQLDSGVVEVVDLTFYRALAAAGEAATASGQARRRLVGLVEDGAARLARWAQTGPARFGCRAALLRAEQARLQGDELTALNAYQAAADAAGDSRQLGVAALVAERCAAFHAAAGRAVDAEAHLRAARAAYRCWGVQARVEVLDGRLATPAPDTAAAGVGAGVGATLAQIRAAQGISEATTLGELVDRLMRAVLQLSGGDYAALLLIDDGGPLELAAEADVRRSGHDVHVVTHPSGTAAEAASLPACVLQTALAGGEPVHLEGAAVAGAAFARPGLTRTPPRSVLCLPMFLQRTLRGLLYMENRLLPGAFPLRNRDLLEVLASQAAVSIENTLARQRLQASEQRYRILVEAAPDAIITTDPDGQIVLVNSQTERLFGYARDELLGRRIDSLIDQDHARHRNGDQFPVETTRSSAQTASGRLDTVIVRDISERRRFEERLRYLADHDTLTGLFNRRRLESELELEVARSHRYRSWGALLLVDLDNFKDINDVLGHHVGDEVLRATAQTLRDRTRECDIVARLGGDEFALLLPETTVDQADLVAHDLLHALAAVRIIPAGRQITATASIGVAGIADIGGTAAQVLAAADVALYQAKENGRNRSAVYDVRRLSAIRSRLTWSDRLRQALDHEGFLLYGQPILDLRSATITRYELLIRMRTDDPSAVALPDAFLPIAERTGLITHIDRWVLARAVHLMATGALDQMSVSVNLSAPSLTDQELPGYVAGLLADHPNLDPRKLILEITETAAITDLGKASRLASQLRDLGCGLALDDFGSGFGSFYYLKHLPLTIVKLDGDFVRSLRQNPVDRLVIDAMVTIAQELDLRTVAEYVQDEHTCQWLAEHGVDYAQGYWIGRPTPIGSSSRAGPSSPPGS
jgi:diguanylate cyclase (GGDEF)-like protein